MPGPICPVIQIFTLLSQRWMLLILRTLSGDTHSFNAIKRELGSISSRTLVERLRRLEAEGFVERRIISTAPFKVEYLLTKKSCSFKKYLVAIGEWAKKWEGKKFSL